MPQKIKVIKKGAPQGVPQVVCPAVEAQGQAPRHKLSEDAISAKWRNEHRRQKAERYAQDLSIFFGGEVPQNWRQAGVCR